MEEEYQKIERLSNNLSEEGERIFNILENSNYNIFLTGRAGTGKSTLLNHFRINTKKNVAVLAPTGVAAVNVQGQTIHSFFKFPIGITVDDIHKKSSKVYKNLDAIIIDEISMVRADLLDCVEKFMRMNGKYINKPFGGAQIIVIGDPYQLPPVMTKGEQYFYDGIYESPYFFDAHCFGQANFCMIELNQVYRQVDRDFIDILDSLRSYNLDNGQIEKINKRICLEDVDEDMAIHLVSTNFMADNINLQKLDKLKGKEKIYSGFVSGDFKEKDLPTKKELILKKGAQVMLLNNDQKRRWVNGDIGKITNLERSSIEVEFEDGRIENVEKHSWEKLTFIYDDEDGRIKGEVSGNFSQFPLKLAWAVTIHKGQGKTYDKVIIDFGAGTFASGQAYVALSRCRSIDGLTLKTPLEKRHIIIDKRVKDFMKSYPKIDLRQLAND